MNKPFGTLDRPLDHRLGVDAFAGSDAFVVGSANYRFDSLRQLQATASCCPTESCQVVVANIPPRLEAFPYIKLNHIVKRISNYLGTAMK